VDFAMNCVKFQLRNNYEYADDCEVFVIAFCKVKVTPSNDWLKTATSPFLERLFSERRLYRLRGAASCERMRLDRRLSTTGEQLLGHWAASYAASQPPH